MCVTMEQIIESNRIKEESCNQCMKSLKGTLTEEQLLHFKDAFMSATKGLVFREKTTAEN